MQDVRRQNIMMNVVFVLFVNQLKSILHEEGLRLVHALEQADIRASIRNSDSDDLVNHLVNDLLGLCI